MKKLIPGCLHISAIQQNVHHHKKVVIYATDTTVIIMGMYYAVRIPGLEELWLQKRNITLPLHTIVETMSKNMNIVELELTAVILGIGPIRT